MLEFQFSADAVNELAHRYSADGPLLSAALRSTVSKMQRWTRTRARRELAKALKLNHAIVRRRLAAGRPRSRPGVVEGDVWFGLNPVGLEYLKPRQDGQGVSTRQRSVKSAFIAKPKGSARKLVFKRRGRERLPVDKQELDIYENSVERLDAGVLSSAEFESQFYTTLEAELKWRTNSI